VTISGSFDFNIGVILLVFQTDGNLPSLKDILKITQIGEQRIFLQSLK